MDHHGQRRREKKEKRSEWDRRGAKKALTDCDQPPKPRTYEEWRPGDTPARRFPGDHTIHKKWTLWNWQRQQTHFWGWEGIWERSSRIDAQQHNLFQTHQMARRRTRGLNDKPAFALALGNGLQQGCKDRGNQNGVTINAVWEIQYCIARYCAILHNAAKKILEAILQIKSKAKESRNGPGAGTLFITIF